MKNTISALAAMLAASAFALDYGWTEASGDYTFGTSASPLPSQKITVPDDGRDARSLTFFPALDAVLEIAGGTLNFQTPASVSVTEGGTVKFSAPVSCSGELSLCGGMSVVDNLYPQNSVVVPGLSNISVEAVDVVSAELETYGSVRMAHPYHVKEEPDGKTLQLQFIDGSWLKCVKIKLADQSGGLAVKVVYRRYIDKIRTALGSDFDAIETGSASEANNGMKAANYDTSRGCHLKSLKIVRNGAVRGVSFAAAAELAESSKLKIAADADVRFEGVGGTPDGSDTLSAAVELNGRLSVNRNGRTVFAGETTGSGVLVLEPWDGASYDTSVTLGKAGEEVESDLFRTSSHVSLVKNCSAASVTNVSDVWIRTSPAGNAKPAKVCMFSNDGNIVKFQAQIYDGGYVKCAVIELKTGNDASLCGALLSTPFVKFASKEEGEAFLGNDISSVALTGTHGNYYPVAMTIHTFDRTGCRETVLSGTSRQNEGRIEVGAGNRLLLDAAHCLPTNGVVTVFGGGEAESVAANVESGDAVLIKVLPGGVFRQKANDSFAHKGPWFNIDGGELALQRRKDTSYFECGSYLNRVTLSGGAKASGLRARIGSNIISFYPAWNICRGTSGEPVTVTCGFTFVGIAAGQRFYMMVDDFADGADLITRPGADWLEGDGAFAEFASKLEYRIPVFKRGAGTWLVKSASPNYHAAVRIEAGELALGVDNAFSAAELISLDGGSLTVTDATVQEFVKLAVTAASSLNIADGSSVAFAGVKSDVDWGGRLAVTGDFTRTSPLRIGTSAVLSAQQLGMIRINRHRAVQDENGYLHPIVPGPVVIVR